MSVNTECECTLKIVLTEEQKGQKYFTVHLHFVKGKVIKHIF